MADGITNPWNGFFPPPWTCQCGKIVPDSVKVCFACKTPKIVGQVTKDSQQSAADAGGFFYVCSECQAKCFQESRACWNCGEPKPDKPLFVDYSSATTYTACRHCGEVPKGLACNCDRRTSTGRVPSTYAMDMLEIEWKRQGFAFDVELQNFIRDKKGRKDGQS